MRASDTSRLSAAVLGRLLLMQNVLCNLPNEESIFSFVCRGLRDLPGVIEARHTRGQPAADDTSRSYPLSSNDSSHGELCLEISEPEAFAPYDPYVRNFVFMVTVILEERQQRRVIEDSQTFLEQRVEERTRQLSQEIAERRAVEEELRRSRNMLAHTLDSIPQAVFWKDLRGVYLGCNRVFAQSAGLEHPEQVLGMTDFDLPWPLAEAQAYRRDDQEVIRTGQPKRHLIEPLQQFDGTRLWIDTSKVPLTDEHDNVYGILGVYDDISERLRAEEDKRRLQEQLVQAQKMESIGRLAGGVAHDFNNILQAIIGYAGLALEQTDNPLELRESLEEILTAAHRSAELTHQLLAFARKQAVAPRVLDLNDTVASMLKLLQRLIRENIQLVWRPGSDLWPIKMDHTQIHQMLANLTVNARDAIEDSGQITIETANVTLDPSVDLGPDDAPPGDYVTLTVRDDGCGIAPEALGHLFEPFFTTKVAGKGTGLGLATVYGVVKQNGGYVCVSSAPGRGSTFTVGLPRCTLPLVVEVSPGIHTPQRSPATILLVEDEEQILQLGRHILEKAGYLVLTAHGPENALRILADRRGKIDLLVTDVVMPGLNGRELMTRAKAMRPEMRGLYISGYTADIIANQGVLEAGVEFLQKPFAVEDLLHRVSLILAQDKTCSA